MVRGDEGVGRGPVRAAAWNAAHAMGTAVTYWPGVRGQDGKPSRTRSEAWEVGCGDVVVAVEGKAGGIAISHVSCGDDCAVCRTAMQEFVQRAKTRERQRR